MIRIRASPIPPISGTTPLVDDADAPPGEKPRGKLLL